MDRRSSGSGFISMPVWYLATLVTLIFGLSGFVLIPRAHAADGDLWVDTGMWSRHDDRSKGYRENNSGAGVEYQYNPMMTLHAGHYWNSLNRSSDYVGVAWQPQEFYGCRPGILLAAVTGYGKHGSAVVLAPVPMLSWNYKSVGVNLYAVPGVLVAVQFKLKVW
jgi:hypothetical protein